MDGWRFVDYVVAFSAGVIVGLIVAAVSAQNKGRKPVPEG